MKTLHNTLVFGVGAVAWLAAAGCALTGKSDTITFRYFTPETSGASTTAPVSTKATLTSADAGATAVALRLGKVASAGYLRERIAFRSAENEINYLEDRVRWTESPDAYLRRAISKELFETRGFAQRVSGPGLTLELELTGFEEVRGAKHVARVEITWWLRDDRHVLTQRTAAFDRPIEGGEGDPMTVSRALGAGLQSAVSELGSTLTSELNGSTVRN